MGNKLNITGKKINRLFVINEAYMKNHASYWNCICDCGNKVIIKGALIVHGHTKSCGCLRADNHKKIMVKHGACKTPEYKLWTAIKERCYNKNSKYFCHYGGRGIKMCYRWRVSFKNFLADVGRRPSKEYSGDRFPNKNGDYKPSNFRWATKTQQSRNTRSALLLKYKGEIKPLTEWCEIYNLCPYALRSRLFRLKWDIERAFKTKSKRNYTEYVSFLAKKRANHKPPVIISDSKLHLVEIKTQTNRPT